MKIAAITTTVLFVAACQQPPMVPRQQTGSLPRVHQVEGDRVDSLLRPDAIPSIDDPRFVPASHATFMRDEEPVVGVVIDGVAKAYSTWFLDRHEIVNDMFAEKPVAVTW